jgi:uncharacterized damage-inducible protein DinB
MSIDIQPDFTETQAARLEAACQHIGEVLHQPAVAERLRSAPGESEWSAMQTLGHTVEMIPYWLSHCSTLAAAETPPNFGRTLDDPERLAGPERGQTTDPDVMLGYLNEEVTAAAAAIRQLSQEQLHKHGTHVRRGIMTVADVVNDFIVSHTEEHLAQVKAALGE